MNGNSNMSLPGNEVITECRKRSLDLFQQLGVPGKMNEDYKYSSAEKIFRVEMDFFLPDETDRKQDISHFEVPGLNAWQVVLVNGRISKSNSNLDDLPDGVTLIPLKDEFASHEKILNAHFNKC